MTSWVPDRRPSSWPPPCNTGSSCRPSLTYNNPTPFGPPNLCPVSERRSTPSSPTSIGRETNAWIASVWTAVLGLTRLTNSATSATSWMVPVSLLTAITDTTQESSSTRPATCSGSTLPYPSTSAVATRQPRRPRKPAASRTASCSVAPTTTPPRPPPARAAPFTARLSDSVPPPVKTISWGRQPSRPAARSRADSSAFLARRDTS